MRKFLTTIILSIARFLQVQLFLSLVSLPILVAWGLPFSFMTAVGNFIFNPFLGLFLLCASLIFFTELLYIPNQLLITILEYTSTWWSYFLGWGSKNWLISFYKPSPLTGLAVMLGAWAIMHHKKLGRLYPSIGALTLLFCIYSGYLWLTCPISTAFQIKCGRRAVTVLKGGETLTIRDNGAFGKKRSASSWVQYNLIPELAQKTGTLMIDRIVTQEPTTQTFEALTALCQNARVKSIEVPYFEGEVAPTWWHAFFVFKKTAEQENVKVVRTSKEKISTETVTTSTD